MYTIDIWVVFFFSWLFLFFGGETAITFQGDVAL